MILSYHDIHPGAAAGPVDVCIIGSGGGGATMAYYLAKAGYSVIMLEKGGYFPTEELGREEVTMLSRIQALTIFAPTSGEHTRISLIGGECVGGGTVAAEGAAYNFPEQIKDDWEKLGLKSFSRDNKQLYTYMAELNERLSVIPVAWKDHNKNNQLLARAAEREGIKWKPSHRAVIDCMRCSKCTQGCRFGCKQDHAVTFITWTQKYNCTIYSGAKAEKVTVNYPDPEDYPYHERLKSASEAAKEDIYREMAGQAKNAPAKFTISVAVTDRKAPVPRHGLPESKTLTIHARHLVLAAGPLGNTRLLLKSGINPNRVVGKRFTTHPSCFAMARFPDNLALNAWDGQNCSVEMHHYSVLFREQPYFDPQRHGIILESAFSPPWGFANVMPGIGPEILEQMKAFNYFGGMETITKSDSYGEITEKEVKFDISDSDNERLLFSTHLMAKLFFRVGAKKVYTSLPGLVLTSPQQLDEIYKFRFGKKKGFMCKQTNLYSGHIFGGCIMGPDPKNSFADQTGECHTVKGLWVADGSAFPTNTGVNCLMSITLVARKIAQEFIGKVQKK